MWSEAYPQPACFINGDWVATGLASGFVVTNPATEDTLGEIPQATDLDQESAIEAAHRAFASWKRVPAWKRSEYLRKVADVLCRQVEKIARWLTLEQGKPLTESRAEVQAAADVFTWASEECKRTYGRTIPSRIDGLHQTTYREPIGPCALFSPWNFPIVLPARKVATAIAAGCTCVLKPAEQTPASAMALVMACAEAGIPAGVLNLILGEPASIVSRLIRSPRVRKISLTGSIPIGRAVARLAGEHLKKCTFELGGHSPIIVLPDCDLDHAVNVLVRTKYRNAGQVCVSPSRFFVHDSIWSAFTDRYIQAVSGIVVGDGLEDGVGMGPLTTQKRLASVEEFVGDAQDRGATVAKGGQRLGGAGYYFAPTILLNVPEDSRIMTHEPFGPVASFIKFGDVEDALRSANRLQYGLSAYLFTRDLGLARRLTERLEAGLVGINHVAFGLPETPMCGVKDSGYGHEGGSEGIQEYLVTKFVNELAL